MLQHSPEAATAIEGPERAWQHRLLIDWDGDGSWDHELTDLSAYVSRTVRDQSISATAPEELQLIEGHAAGKLTVEASGTYEGLSLAGHFAPYNGLSVFYSTGITLGVSGTYEIGVDTAAGPEWFRQFTGVVRDIYTNRATSGVTIELLDNIERLRTSVDIPPYGLWQEYLQVGMKRGMLCDSSSIIDLAARAGEFTMGPHRFVHWPADWPDSEASMVFSAPLHGSVLPEIGTLDNYQEFHKTEAWHQSGNPEENAHAEAYTRGPHGYLALAALPDTPDGATMQQNVYWCDDTRGVAGGPRGTWILAGWVYYDGDRAEHAFSRVCTIQIRKNQLRLIIECATGRVWGELQVRGGGPLHIGPARTMPGHGWHYIEAAFECAAVNPTFVEMRTRVNDDQTPVVRVSDAYPGIDNDPLSGLVTLEKVYAISDVTIFQSGYVNALDPQFLSRDLTPLDTARVSWGRNRLTHTLRDSGREAWDIASEVAAAEFGVVLFDEHGRFTFWNYDDIVARQDTIVRTFTIDTLAKLGLRNALDSVRNVWTVTTTSGRALPETAYDLGDDGVPLFEAASGDLLPANFVLWPGDNKVFFVPVDDSVISVEPFNLNPAHYFAPNVPWGQHGPHAGMVAWQVQDRNVHVPQGPNTEQKMVSRDLFRLAISNGYGPGPNSMAFVGPNDQPRFRVPGTRVFTDKPRTWTLRDEDSISQHGERVIEVGRGSFWLQDEFQTKAMLRDLVSRLGRPIPVSDSVTVPMDPRTQIGDTVAFTDPEGFGADMRLQLYGIRRELSTEGGTDTYSIEMVEPPASYGIWDHPTYGIWDQSFIWSK